MIERFKIFNKKLKILLIFLLTIAIFLFIFSKIDVKQVIELMIKVNIPLFLLAFFVYIFSLLVSAMRWRKIVASSEYSITYFQSIYIIIGALPLIAFTPSRSGDLVKAYFLKNKVPMTITAGTVLTEKFFDFGILIILIIFGCYLTNFSMNSPTITGLFVIFVALLIIFFFILFSEKRIQNEKIKNLLNSLHKMSKNYVACSQVFGFSLIIWICAILQTFLLAEALGFLIPLSILTKNLPITILTGMIPVTLGGMGTRDAAMIILFSSFGTTEQIISLGLFYSLQRYWIPAILAIPVMKRLLTTPF